MNKNVIIKPFIKSFQGKYIAGYSYFNGYRDVNMYIKSFYDQSYIFVLDYLHAKQFSYETAKKHYDRISNNK